MISPLLIPILALLIPIVAILSSHQQKMARIIQEARSQGDPNELAALRHELRELKELVHTQMLALDSMSSRTSVTPAMPADVQERLRSTR